MNHKLLMTATLSAILAAALVTALEAMGRFVGNSPANTLYNDATSVNFGTEASSKYFLRFGSVTASTTFFFDANDTVYQILECGYKCNPTVGIVKQRSARGKCQTRKLSNGHFNVHCHAIDAEGKRHSSTLLDAVRETY